MLIQQKNSTAAALFIVILLCALLALLSLESYYYLTQMLKLQSATQHSSAARNLARSLVMEKMLNGLSYEGGQRFFCEEKEARIGLHTAQRRLCSLNNSITVDMQQQALTIAKKSSNSAQFPLIDYERIFSNAAPGHCLQNHTLTTSSTVFRPSPESLQAAALCTGISFDANAACLISANLELKNTLYMPETPPQAAYWLLAASGYINIEAPLSLAGDLMILSGGDLRISSLHSETQGLQLTLVSASGTVQIDRSDPELKLRIIAWQGASGDLRGLSTSNQVFPPLRDRIPLSLEKY